jgi:hypothetical protein
MRPSQGGDPVSYQSAADAKLACNKAAMKRGMNVQRLDPPWPKRDSTVLGIPVTFDTERAIQEAQSKLNKSCFFCLSR